MQAWKQVSKDSSCTKIAKKKNWNREIAGFGFKFPDNLICFFSLFVPSQLDQFCQFIGREIVSFFYNMSFTRSRIFTG